MKIANIIHEKELINHTKVDYVNYYNEKIGYEKVDQSLPTLYVGWVFMKACNPENQIIQNANILSKRIITNELFWEFSFDESKGSHVKGVQNFINHAPEFYFQPKYHYINLDPVFFQIKEEQDLFDYLPQNIDAVYAYKNEMLYLFYEKQSRFQICGLDMKMYSFFNFNTTDIIGRIASKTTRYFNDLDGQMYLNQYKIFPNFSFLKRYLVVILSK